MMLRNYSSSSLPNFVKELRSSIRDVQRSYSLSEHIKTSTVVLWTRLRVALWDERVFIFADYFRAQAVKQAETLQQKFVKAGFEGFKATRLAAIPRSIAILVSCLQVLENGSGTSDVPSLEKAISDLGLSNQRGGGKRQGVFRVVGNFGKLKKKEPLLSPRSIRRLSALLTDFAEALRYQPFTAKDEALYNASLLKKIVVTLSNCADFDLSKSVQEYLDDGESSTNMQKLLGDLLKEPGSSAVCSSERAQQMNDVFKTLVGKKTSAPQNRQSVNKTFKFGENSRWRKDDRDCVAIASCPRNNCRIRWFVESSRIQVERFIFTGEEDLMFEWMYIDYDPPPNGKHSVEAKLVELALSAWSTSVQGDDSVNVLPRPRPPKVAFDVNFHHADKIESPAFTDIARVVTKYGCAENAVLGCHVGDEDNPSAVVVRAYSAVKSSTVQISSLANFLKQLLADASLLQHTLLLGGFPLLRMCATREPMQKEGVISLLHPVSFGISMAQKVVQAAVEICAKSPDVLLSEHVSHFVLHLILQHGICADLVARYFSGLLVIIHDAKRATKWQVDGRLRKPRLCIPSSRSASRSNNSRGGRVRCALENIDE